MKDIFVSYTTSNSEQAHAVVNYFEKKGVNCFIAPRDIDAGKAYASNLMKAIEDCKLVILIASRGINNSEHVLNEVDAIVDKKKAIMPIFIEEFDLNDDFRYYLGRKQWIIAYPNAFESYLAEIFDSALPYIPKKEKVDISTEKEDSGNQKQKTTFDYIPERGIMINPKDHHRNISFRSDTLINMMGGIFDQVNEKAGEGTAEGMFFSSGYKSGKNFAEQINNQFDTGHSFGELKKKLIKWCEFDSAVGWGKFEIDINLDDNDCLVGTLTINEAILVDKSHKRHTCEFIKGYCTGVLGTMLDFLEVELQCVECPLKNRFKSSCVFKIVVREAE